MAGTIFIYYAALDYGFLLFDDNRHISSNTLITQPGFANLIKFWTGTFFDLFVPVVYTVWWTLSWISQSLWGELRPGLFHGANLTIHITNSILVYALTRLIGKNSGREFLKNPTPAIIVAILFAWHPLQVEAVAWISSLRDLLAFFFTTLYMILVLSVWSQSKKNTKTLFLAHFFLIFALLCKPVAIVSPLMLMSLGYGFSAQPFNKILKTAIMGLCLGLPVVIVTMMAQKHATVLIYNPVWGRPLVLSDAITFYLGKLLLPINLAPDYFRTPGLVLADTFNWVKLLLPAALIIWVVKFRETKKELVALVLAALIPMLPTSGLASFAFQKFSTVTDHYLYFSIPFIGILLLIGLSLIAEKRVRLGLTCTVLLFLLILSHNQARYWKDSTVLAARTLEVSPGSFMGNIIIYNYYNEKEKYSTAVEHLKTALLVDDRSPVLVSSTGELMVILERFKEARMFFEKYVNNLDHFKNQPPEFIAKIYLNYGISLFHLEEIDLARQALIKARELHGNSSELEKYLDLAARHNEEK